MHLCSRSLLRRVGFAPTWSPLPAHPVFSPETLLANTRWMSRRFVLLSPCREASLNGYVPLGPSALSSLEVRRLQFQCRKRRALFFTSFLSRHLRLIWHLIW